MVFGLLFAWPLARRWLPQADRLTVAVTAFGLSLGSLSLWMFALALLPGALSLWTALALPAVVCVVGLLLAGSHQSSVSSHQSSAVSSQSLSAGDSSRSPRPALPITNYGSRITFYAHLHLRCAHAQVQVLRFTPYAALSILASLAVISVNVLYYPFYYADTLSRYGLFARRIFESGGLPASVQGYPLLVSLGYAWAFFAAGAVNDRLAGLISAAFAIALVAVTYLLGREMHGRRAGVVAAFLAATSSLFVIWATSGYVDIPTGFFFALAALFAWRWLEGGRRGDAWLCGLAAGLAIWTKQAGLAILPSLAAVLVLGAWQTAERHRLLVGLRGQRSALALGRPLPAWGYLRDAAGAGAIFGAAVVLICGPWYFRNYLLSGLAGIVPLPGEFYAVQADHRPIALLPFVTRPAEWGWPFALLALGGLAWAAVEAIAGERARGGEAGGGRLRPLFALAFILPYHLAWWWGFSYEARFLLTLLPFYAVLAGRAVDWAVSRAGLVEVVTGRRWAVSAVGGLCLAVALLGAWPRLGAVYHLALEPLASEHDIRLRLRPDQTLTVDYLRAHLAPATDAILLMDGSYEYFLTDYDTGVFYPVTLAEAQEWDYVVVPRWAAGIYASLGHDQSEFWLGLSAPALFREVYRAPVDGGSIIYQILY